MCARRFLSMWVGAVADPDVLKKRGGRRKTMYAAPSSFIANAHNELYAFYKAKGDLLKQILDQWGAPPPSSF